VAYFEHFGRQDSEPDAVTEWPALLQPVTGEEGLNTSLDIVWRDAPMQDTYEMGTLARTSQPRLR